MGGRSVLVPQPVSQAHETIAQVYIFYQDFRVGHREIVVGEVPEALDAQSDQPPGTMVRYSENNHYKVYSIKMQCQISCAVFCKKLVRERGINPPGGGKLKKVPRKRRHLPMKETTDKENSAPEDAAQTIQDLGAVWRTRGAHGIHCLTVIGQIEGHVEAPQGQKTTKYEHVIPQLVAVQEDPAIEGLLVLLNTVGGDVEAGLALAELIASISKPSAAVVLGGGHSIGIPLAVSAQRSFIVPTATMTIHPVRHSGMILGVPQTMRWFEQMQQRITGFVVEHSGIQSQRYTQLMMSTGELVMDVGTVLDGRKAVKEKLIDQLGGLSDALSWLYREIEGRG